MYSVVIDSREHDLIKLLDDPKTGQLDVGDIHIIANDGSIACIIERKTLDDFSASIVDGRYREQKQRLLALGKPIVYLVEGATKGARGVPYSTLQSAMISLSFRDGIHVVRSSSMGESVQLLEIMVKKVDQLLSDHPVKQYIPNPCIKGKKRDNYTAGVVYHNMLSCIPHVSETTARAISATYPSIPLLQARLMEHGEHALCHLKFIGPTVSKRIYDALCG